MSEPEEQHSYFKEVIIGDKSSISKEPHKMTSYYGFIAPEMTPFEFEEVVDEHQNRLQKYFIEDQIVDIFQRIRTNHIAKNTSQIAKNQYRDLYSEFAELKARLNQLEGEMSVLKSTTGAGNIDRMRAVIQKLLSEKNIPDGRIVAVTYDGDLVAEGSSTTEVLKVLRKLNDKEIFLWKIGSEFVGKW